MIEDLEDDEVRAIALHKDIKSVLKHFSTSVVDDQEKARKWYPKAAFSSKISPKNSSPKRNSPLFNLQHA